MHTGEGWRLGHRPALDGVRGIAVLLVFGGHAMLLPGNAGAAGVAVFFALSGFLITTLLLEEHAREGRVRFGAFYLRRARRLLPALFVMLACVVVTWRAFGWQLPDGHVAAAIFYYANWQQIADGTMTGPLAHMWSLAVEEQFYLVWPCLIAAVIGRGRRWVVGVCAAGIVASVTVKVWLLSAGASPARLEYGSDVRADALLVGALVAAGLAGRRAPALPRVLPWLAAGGVAWGVVGSSAPAVVASLVPAAAAVLILCSVTGTRVRVLEWEPLRWVGRRSYGLYLWHLPVVAVGSSTIGLGWWQAAVLLPVGLGIAAVSWRFVEEPCLRRSVRPVEAPGLLGDTGRVDAPRPSTEGVPAAR